MIVTSAITFVPENYNRMILGIADEPSVVGVLILDNRSWKIWLQSLALILTFSSPRLGLQLLVNSLSSSLSTREKKYRSLGKQVWILPTVNSDEVRKIIDDQKIDLIVNCRTRFIFKEKILNAPKIGCINIHHGLLPIQRGLMCDFWAHLEGKPFGFSFHLMTSKIDDGPILEVVQASTDGKNYLKSILQSSIQEEQTCRHILQEIEKTGTLPVKAKDYNPFSSALGEAIIYRKNPSLTDGYKAQLRGIKV
jgi:methionyl-tRNA formyltransferase